jgi:ribosomal protein S18 acetylase RimI-like enzyme
MQADVSFTNDGEIALSTVTDVSEVREIVADEPLIGLCLTEENAEQLTTPSFTFPLFAIVAGKLAGFVDLQDLETRMAYSSPEVVQWVLDKTPDRKPIMYCIERSRVAILHWFNERGIDGFNNVYYLCSLGVRRPYRKNGVASMLVARHMDVARDMGAKYLVVETTGNGSRRIFQKLGAQEINFISYDQMSQDLGCNRIQDHDGFATFVVTL